MAANSTNGSSDGSGTGDGHPPAGANATFFGRMSATFLKPPRPTAPERPLEQLSESERAERIRQVDPTERKIGYLAAVLIGVLAILYFGPFVSNPHKSVAQTAKRSGATCPSGYRDVVVKGAHECTRNVIYSRSHWVFLMGVLLFFAIFVALTVKVGKRSFVAFAVLFSGFAVEALTGSIIGLLFVVGGGWLILRAYRVQKFGSPTARAVVDGGGARTGSRAAGTSRAPAAPRRAKKGATPAESAVRAKPDANKRYTPKAPQRKRAAPPS